jgi:hypothetical protein
MHNTQSYGFKQRDETKWMKMALSVEIAKKLLLQPFKPDFGSYPVSTAHQVHTDCGLPRVAQSYGRQPTYCQRDEAGWCQQQERLGC